MDNPLRFEAKKISATQMVEVLKAEPNRKTLLLQNQSATAIFYIGNSENVEGAARYKLAPGAELSSDIFTPTGAIYAQSSEAGAELTVITGL